VKEVLFDMFNLRMANAYILHSKETGENIPLGLFYEMIAEGQGNLFRNGPGVLLQADLMKRPFSIQ
jgi:hypothetical protein